MILDLVKWPATITFNMPDICQTVPDSLTTTIKTFFGYRGGVCPETFQFY